MTINPLLTTTGGGGPAQRLAALREDLRAEQAAVDAMVCSLDQADWLRPTPAVGWCVHDQISHLCYFDETAAVALSDPEAFGRHAAEALGTAAGGVRPDVETGRSMTPSTLLERWRVARADLLDAASRVPPDVRVPWYALAMSPASFISARLMETWAHGQDIVDGLDLGPVISDRVRHVCHIGVTARRFAFMINGLEDPGDPIRVEVRAPSGGLWTWGAEDAADRVEGPALDLALVVTQRRHLADTALRVTGSTASAWIAIAQAFAGPPGGGRAPIGSA